MYQATIYEKKTGRILQRTSCSSAEELAGQLVPEDCDVLKGQFLDGNLYHIENGRGVENLRRKESPDSTRD